jgi:hypothetical protein
MKLADSLTPSRLRPPEKGPFSEERKVLLSDLEVLIS